MIQQLNKEVEEALAEYDSEQKVNRLSMLFGKTLGCYDATVSTLESEEKHTLKSLSRLINKVFLEVITNLRIHPSSPKDMYSSRPFQSNHPEIEIFLSENRPIDDSEMNGNHGRLQRIFKEFEKLDKGVKEVMRVSDIVQASKSSEEDAILSVMKNIEDYQGAATNSVSSTMKSRLSVIQQKYENGLQSKGIRVVHRKAESVQTDMDSQQIQRKLEKLYQFQRKWHKLQEQQNSYKRQLHKKQRQSNYHNVQVMQLTMQKISLEVQLQRLLKKTQYVQIYNQIDQMQMKVDRNYRQLIEKQQREFRGQTVYRPNASRRKYLLSFDNNIQICILPFKDICLGEEKLDCFKSRLQQATDRVNRDKKIHLLEKKVMELQTKNEAFSRSLASKNQALKHFQSRLSDGIQIFMQKGVQTNMKMQHIQTVEGYQDIDGIDVETQRRNNSLKTLRPKKKTITGSLIKKSNSGTLQLQQFANKRKGQSITGIRLSSENQSIERARNQNQVRQSNAVNRYSGDYKQSIKSTEPLINKEIQSNRGSSENRKSSLNKFSLLSKHDRKSIDSTNQVKGNDKRLSKSKEKALKQIYENKVVKQNSKNITSNDQNTNKSPRNSSFRRISRGFAQRKSLHAPYINLPEYNSSKVATQTQDKTNSVYYKPSNLGIDKQNQRRQSKKGKLNKSYDTSLVKKEGKDLELPSIYKKSTDLKQTDKSFSPISKIQNREKSVENTPRTEDILLQIKGLLQNDQSKKKSNNKLHSYIKMFEQLHKRCGSRCQHMQKFYKSISQFKTYALRKELRLPKHNI